MFRSISKLGFCTLVGEQSQKPFRQALAKQIRFTGPMTIAQYMHEVLTHPKYGYYTNKSEVLGKSGDFTTSPEISQMFGECLGIWMANEWMKMGSPTPLQIVEFGPGRGTLMHDMLRTLHKLNLIKNQETLSVHLIEVSKTMRSFQQLKLCRDNASNKCMFGPEVSWHETLSSVPKGFSIFVAHEFFDALPIHQFVRQNNDSEFTEVLIDATPDEDLKFVTAKSIHSKTYLSASETRNVVEVSPKTGLIVEEMCERIVSDGGAALIADYGHNGEKGDTFRAFKNHKLHDPLAEPGQADLTADVDFNYIRQRCSNDTLCYGPVDQRDFLLRLGMETRKAMLLEKCGNEQMKSDIESAYKMLTEEMGQRFKFMSVFPKTMDVIHNQYPPAGFESHTNRKSN